MIEIEVAYALPQRQVLVALRVPDNTTAAEAVALSGLPAQFPEHDLSVLGVWSQRVAPQLRLKAGDRVEIYRPLQQNPREARRALAAAGTSTNENAGGRSAKSVKRRG